MLTQMLVIDAAALIVAGTAFGAGKFAKPQFLAHFYCNINAFMHLHLKLQGKLLVLVSMYGHKVSFCCWVNNNSLVINWSICTVTICRLYQPFPDRPFFHRHQVGVMLHTPPPHPTLSFFTTGATYSYVTKFHNNLCKMGSFAPFFSFLSLGAALEAKQN